MRERNEIERYNKTAQFFIDILISLVIFVSIFFIFIAASGCSSEKQLKKAINKHGQKESVAYVVLKYPEYFKQKVVRDTIHDTIPILIPQEIVNTDIDSTELSDLINRNESLITEIDGLKLELFKANGKIKARITIPEKQASAPVQIITSNTCQPCPDIEVLKSEIEKQIKATLILRTGFDNFTRWFFWICLIIIGLYFANKKLKLI